MEASAGRPSIIKSFVERIQCALRQPGVGVQEQQRAAARHARAFIHLQAAIGNVESDDLRKIEPAHDFESTAHAPAVNDYDFSAVIDRRWPQRAERCGDLSLFIERGNNDTDWRR